MASPVVVWKSFVPSMSQVAEDLDSDEATVRFVRDLVPLLNSA
jgi:hypothetical protein